MAPGRLVETVPDENGMAKDKSSLTKDEIEVKKNNIGVATEENGRMKPLKRNGEIVIGDVEHDGRVVLYIIKADETSYINYIKQLILAQELDLPHVLSIIDTTSQWAYQIHPERMVPSLKDKDPATGEQINVFEGTACLQYLADRFDVDGDWTGRTAAERAAVYTWTAYQTAGIGATAKYWLYFLRGYPTRKDPIQLPRTIEKLSANVLKQWDILNQRLSLPGQTYIAVKERPTLADLSYFPFAMPRMFRFLGVEIKDWPHIERWHGLMMDRPAVQDIMARAPTFGHDMTEEQARVLKEAV